MYHISNFYFTVRESPDDALNHYAVQVSRGRMKFFDEIDKHMRPQIIRQTYKYHLRAEDREDTIQELMEIALRNCYRYNPDIGHYRHYTLRITKYELLKLYYRIADADRMELTKSNYTATFSAEDYRDKKTDSPLEVVIQEEGVKYLLNDNGPCTPLERKVCKYFDHGYGVKDIARDLSMSEKSVRNSLYRVKLKALKVNDEA